MRVLLADDHDLVRDALGALILKDAPETELVVVSDLPQALETVKSDPSFAVILLDLCMPGMNGVSGAEKMVKAAPYSPVIIMSGTANAADVRAAIRCGVKGFVPKTLAGKSLVSAIRLVASGEVYVPMEYMTDGFSDNTETTMLTAREKDVLFELRRGHSNKEIARALDVAETTVKLHLRTISDKLDARNRTDIVIRAIDMGLA